MQKFLFQSIIVIIILFGSCRGQKIQHLLIFPPISEIKVIKTHNKLETDTILSNHVRDGINIQVKSIVPDSIKSTQLKSDETQLQELSKAFADVIEIAENKFKPKVIKAPEFLLNVLDSTNQDFGLCIFNRGFIRTDQNQSNEYTKSMGLNFFTLGTYAFVPNKSFSIIVCFIVDRRQKTFRFYDKSMWRERNPTEKIVIKSQLHHLLMSYFLSQT